MSIPVEIQAVVYGCDKQSDLGRRQFNYSPYHTRQIDGQFWLSIRYMSIYAPRTLLFEAAKWPVDGENRHMWRRAWQNGLGTENSPRCCGDPREGKATAHMEKQLSIPALSNALHSAFERYGSITQLWPT